MRARPTEAPAPVRHMRMTAQEFQSSWRTVLPFIFVLVSLASLLIVPISVSMHVNELRRQMAALDAARDRLVGLELGFAHASAAVRAYLLAPDAQLRDFFATLSAQQRERLSALDSLARAMDDSTLARDLAHLRGHAALWRDEQRAVLSEDMQRAEYLRRRPGARLSHDELFGNALDISRRLSARMQRAAAEIRNTERVGLIAIVILGVLAGVSAVIVAGTAQRFRVRAGQEQALRESALMLTEAVRVDDVLARIAEAAAEVDHAHSAYVERLTPSGDAVEVVAASGSLAPPTGLSVRYDESFTRLSLADGGVHVVDDISAAAPALSRNVPACAGCSGLVVPLRTEGTTHGALVLVRGGGADQFRRRDVEHPKIFGVLASLALRRAVMLRESEEREEQLRHVIASRARLMRGFSHDVKNPLAAADGHADLLEGDVITDPAQQKESLGRIRRSIRAALSLIDDILELARAESGALEIRRESVAMLDVVTNAIDDFRGKAATSGHALRSDLPESLPRVSTDRARVRQILGNLVTNALKYTPRGGEVRLSAGVRHGHRGAGPGKWVTISVRDTGPGISEEQQRLLFREFSRLDPDAGPGMGLGLAISNTITRRLGGELTVESEPDKGSTFTLWLPCGEDKC